MRMSIALPIAAALVAAIGLSSPTPVQAKPKTIASCRADYKACLRKCQIFIEGGLIKRGCDGRCAGSLRTCGGDAATTGRGGAKGVKPGGGKWGGSTAGGQTFPRGPVLGGSTGANGGDKPVVKPISRR